MSQLGAPTFASFRDAIYATSFSPSLATSQMMGAEVELLAHDSVSNRPLPLLGGARSLIGVLRAHARDTGWREVGGYNAIPRFTIGDDAIVTFEPGGQLEISTRPCATASSLITILREIVRPLERMLLDDGVLLRSIGIDPFNDAHSIPQQLPVERYERMTDYFERIGPFGIRMMRQTAAIQLSFDRGANPGARWRLLNDLAPYVTAIFANSPRYCGLDTGHRSYRAFCWRMLDSTRTGVAAPSEDAASEYTRFALAANDMMRMDRNANYQPFSDWLSHDGDVARWNDHLTTLFPEVRPRGHFEVRSCDAIDPSLYAAPIVFLCGLVYDERAAREASLLASDSRPLLRLAGEHGLRDEGLARAARDLFQLSLDGARRLKSYVEPADIEIASYYYAEYTARDRSPADDQPATAPPSRTATAASR